MVEAGDAALRSGWAAVRACHVRPPAPRRRARRRGRPPSATSPASRSFTRWIRRCWVYRSYATLAALVSGSATRIRPTTGCSSPRRWRRSACALRLSTSRRRPRRTRRAVVRQARGSGRRRWPGPGAAGRAAERPATLACLTACSSSARRSVALAPPADRGGGGRRRRDGGHQLTLQAGGIQKSYFCKRPGRRAGCRCSDVLAFLCRVREARRPRVIDRRGDLVDPGNAEDASIGHVVHDRHLAFLLPGSAHAGWPRATRPSP